MLSRDSGSVMPLYIMIVLLMIMLAAPLYSCGSSGEKPKDERITVRLAAPQNAYIEDFDANMYKLWLEEQTGLDLEITWLPDKDAEQIVKMALATGDGLPDAYIGFGSQSLFRNPGIQEYGESGAIIPLDGFIEEYGDNTKKLFAELPEYHIRDLMTSADGHIYYMPGFSSSVITMYRNVMWVNKGWLDALGLDVPKTTDEFRDMLFAFKNMDPNRNGTLDEIPFAGTETFYSKNVYDFLFNAFIYNNEENTRLLLENGIVGFAPVRDEWREALKYMRGLYDDGLISPLSFTQDDQQMKQMANDPRDILGAFMSPGVTYTILQNSDEIMERYIGIGPLSGPDGVKLSTVHTPIPRPNGVITAVCKNPVEVFKLFDLMLSEEACLMGRYGEKSVDWDFAEPGDTSIYGTPATIHIYNQLWNTPQNKHLMQICPYVSRPKYSGGVTWNGDIADGEYINAQAALQYRDFEPEEFVGALAFTPEEEAGIKEVRIGIEKYIKETIIDFIVGKRDIYDDAEWEAYVNGFIDLELEAFLRVAQTAYDRQM